MDLVSSDDVLRFLNRFNQGNKAYTKDIRYSHMCSFFNLSATFWITALQILALIRLVGEYPSKS
jgi:hypothetical protein